jgi:hypothetical protein
MMMSKTKNYDIPLSRLIKLKQNVIVDEFRPLMKSRKEMRESLEEWEFYLSEKDTSIMKEFKAFKAAFIQNSNKEKVQTTLFKYFT